MEVVSPTARPAFSVQFRPVLKVLLSIGLTVAVFYLVFSRADVPSFSSFLADFSFRSFLIVATLLVAGVVLSVWRLQLIAWDLGYPIAWREALAALSVGQIAGSMFFQIVGQLMARGAILARRGMPVAATVTMTIYERAAAASVSLLLAITGGWYVFGRVTLDIESGGLLFLKIIAGLLMALGAGAWLAWGSRTLETIAQQTDRLPLWPIVRNIIMSSAIQVTTMAAYVVAATTISPNISLLDLAAASAVVMLAASLPISLAGWGVRELSAVLVLGIVGVSSQAALMVAILIGTTALGVLGIFALLSFWLASGAVSTQAVQSQSNIDYVALLDWTLPVLVATGVFFQLYVPVGQNQLNVNLADPLALLGGALFVIASVFYERRWPEWRLSWFNAHVIAMTLALAVALLIGASNAGWTSWATTNRFFGWFVLLGFGATAALIVRRGGHEGLMMLLRTVAAVACAMIVLDLFLNILAQAGVDFPRAVLTRQMSGFSQNPNAFAFQVLLALCAAMVADFRPRTATLIMTICFVGIWYSVSRAVFLALPIVLAFAIYMRIVPWRRVAVSLALCACVVLFIMLVPTNVTAAITLYSWITNVVVWIGLTIYWLVLWTATFISWLALTTATWVVAKAAWLVDLLQALLQAPPEKTGTPSSAPSPSPSPSPSSPSPSSPPVILPSFTPASPPPAPVFEAMPYVAPSARYDTLERVGTGPHPAASNAERMESLEGGWKLFLAHPIFGAGLGAYIANRIKEFGVPMVIHSSPLWLLAEMGLVGFAIFIAPVVRLFLGEFRKIHSADPATHLLILILTAFGIISVIHDMMYQRTFWLLLGAGVSYVPILAAANQTSSRDSEPTGPPAAH